MPYIFVAPEPARAELVQSLYDYYTEALEQGYTALLNRIAQNNMGAVTAAIDRGLDTWASLTAASRDKFLIKFETTVRTQAALLLAGANDVGAQAVQLASAALTSLTDKIPVPVVGSIVAKLIEFGSAAAVDELRTRAADEADERIVGSTGGEVRRLFTNDADAIAATTAAIEQYKLIGRYMMTMPATLRTFQEVAAFPAAVFKVRQATSTLNVSLLQIRDYLEAMQTRLAEVQKVYANYETQLRTAMPDAVDAVIDAAYRSGLKQGNAKNDANTYRAIARPVYRAPAEPGGATRLAAYVSFAIAQGYHDAAGIEMQVVVRR